MTTPITGSCLCKAIQYQITTDFELALNCHCTICKKITGSAFESIALTAEDGLELTQGKEHLKSFRLTDKAEKNFCAECGTPIFNTNIQAPGKVIIHIGSLDDPQCVTPKINLHAENMLPWVMNIDQLKTFKQGFGRK